MMRELESKLSTRPKLPGLRMRPVDPRGGNSGTPAGNHTISVTGTSGSVQSSAQRRIIRWHMRTLGGVLHQKAATDEIRC